MRTEMNYVPFDTLIAQKIVTLQYFQKKEVLDFVNFLLSKPVEHEKKAKKQIMFEWEGALKHKFAGETSVELQHKIWEV